MSSNLQPTPAGEHLSHQLQSLAQSAEQRELSIGEMVIQLEGKVYTLFLVILSLPFCQPVALPGVSTPFGFVIALLGLRFALRQKPWLPQWALTTRVPAKVLPTILKGGAWILLRIEHFLHPRLVHLFQIPFIQFLAGGTIFFCGCLLLLPLPIPFSNLLPALTVLLLAASFAERDGFMLMAAWVCFTITILFFILILFGGVEFIDWLRTQFKGVFDPSEIPT